MRVDYEIDFRTVFSEWICLEHTGYARSKAENWWRLRSNAPIPDTIEDAVALGKSGALAETKSITVRKACGKEEFDRIVDYSLGPIPDYREPGWDEDEDDTVEYAPAFPGLDEDDIPF